MKTFKGRKPVHRALPDLAEASKDFAGFAEDDNRTKRIAEILTTVAHRCRRPRPVPFYSMREVADFFGVSLTTVTRVYQQLSREGVLTLIRGSQSMIPARSPRPRSMVRGVVCMPIWLPGFLYFMDWRRWFSELEQELSRQRFILEPIFYRHGEEIGSAFVDRVLDFNPDYVLWNAPVITDLMTMQSITDAGVPILTLLGPKDPVLPGRIYRISYEQALRQGLEEWKASGEIDQVLIPHSVGSNPNVADNYGLPLAEFPLPYYFKFLTPASSLAQYVESLGSDRRTGIFFTDEMFFVRLCAVVPQEMFQLFRRHRVIISRQLTMHSENMPADVTLDWMYVPGQRLARRIATDLSESKGALPSEEEVFEAEWRPRTPLAKIVQLTFME